MTGLWEQYIHELFKSNNLFSVSYEHSLEVRWLIIVFRDVPHTTVRHVAAPANIQPSQARWELVWQNTLHTLTLWGGKMDGAYLPLVSRRSASLMPQTLMALKGEGKLSVVYL